jgi:hypothetical protein
MSQPADAIANDTGNKDLVTRLYAEVFERGNLDLADVLVAPDCLDLHDAQDRRGPARVKEVATMLLDAFPDQRSGSETDRSRSTQLGLIPARR